MSEASWAPSQSTARTTPPPSMRAPYTTKDPDKIVIRAVYGFLNAFAKTPASQLVSGVGSVTDGLILRITTEGLFIADASIMPTIPTANTCIPTMMIAERFAQMHK